MVDEQPKWRTGKLCYIEIPDPAGNTLGIYQQPGLAETEAREVDHHD
jgi:hypothetical protein